MKIGNKVFVNPGIYKVMVEGYEEGDFADINTVVEISSIEDEENNIIADEGEIIYYFEDYDTYNVKMYEGTIIETTSDDLILYEKINNNC